MIKVSKKMRVTQTDFDSLVIEIPRDFALSHGLPEHSFATLTVSGGNLVSEIIPYTGDDEAEVEEFLSLYESFNEGMNRIGD